jgi:malonyl CoA-acyl carrier protein transacylase
MIVQVLKAFVPEKGEIPSAPSTVGGLLIMSAIAVQGAAMQRGEKASAP